MNYIWRAFIYGEILGNEIMKNTNMKYYPVLIPTVNRYNHLRRCIESLQNNTCSDKTELVVILDYPAGE